MIVYQPGVFGIRNLFRMNGSPVYKVAIPTVCSTGFLLFLAYADTRLNRERSVQHPYPLTAFIGFFSFLLTFRLNFAYQRYWEGATAVHQMLSKWLDVAMTLAAWHYQAHSYDDIKPPAFGLNPLATPDAMPERPHAIQPSFEETKNYILHSNNDRQSYNLSWYDRIKPRLRKPNELEKQQKALKRQTSKEAEFSVRSQAAVKHINTARGNARPGSSAIPVPRRFREAEPSVPAHQRPSLTRSERGSHTLMRTIPARMPAPSLFLQELSHLSSLLSATALSTLRNDIEMAESPLTEYIPGQPWPPMNPDELSKDTRKEYGEGSVFWTVAYYMLGLSRSEKHRTLYNAARPFTVLGGVSDQEIEYVRIVMSRFLSIFLCELETKSQPIVTACLFDAYLLDVDFYKMHGVPTPKRLFASCT